MRVLYVVTRSDAIGGAQVHVIDLCQALLDDGHEVLVLAGGHGPFHAALARRDIPFRVAPSLVRPISPLRDAAALVDILRVLGEWQPDLAALHTAKAGFLGRIACRLTGTPAVFTPHGWPVIDRFSSWNAVVFQWAQRLVARLAERVINVSQFEVDLARTHKMAPAGRLALVYNGIPDIPAHLRADPAQEPPRILMVGRMEPPKDHATLLEALALLKAYPWTLDLAGDGPLEAGLRRRASELGIQHRVRFLGFARDPRPIYRQAQIFALSSRFEAFPYTVLEAMRAGLPVVASKLGGIPEAVLDGRTGYLPPASDSQAWSACLARLLADPLRRRQMGAAGRDRFLGAFTLDQMLQQTLALYEQVVRARRTSQAVPTLQTGKATTRATINR